MITTSSSYKILPGPGLNCKRAGAPSSQLFQFIRRVCVGQTYDLLEWAAVFVWYLSCNTLIILNCMNFNETSNFPKAHWLSTYRLHNDGCVEMSPRLPNGNSRCLINSTQIYVCTQYATATFDKLCLCNIVGRVFECFWRYLSRKCWHRELPTFGSY